MEQVTVLRHEICGGKERVVKLIRVQSCFDRRERSTLPSARLQHTV